MASARIILHWVFIFFNSICAIISIAGITGSIYLLQRYTEGSSEIPEMIVQLVIFCLLLVTAIVGTCGAMHGHTKILGACASILLLLSIASIWKLWRYDEKAQMNDSELYVTYNWINELVKPGKMDAVQVKYECCGKRSYHDYLDSNREVPKSCYNPLKELKADQPHEEGCVNAVKNVYLEIYRYEKYVHFGLIGIECLGICLILGLIWKLTAKSRRYHY